MPWYLVEDAQCAEHIASDLERVAGIKAHCLLAIDQRVPPESRVRCSVRYFPNRSSSTVWMQNDSDKG